MKITSEQIVNVIEVQASAAPICWVWTVTMKRRDLFQSIFLGRLKKFTSILGHSIRSRPRTEPKISRYKTEAVSIIPDRLVWFQRNWSWVRTAVNTWVFAFPVRDHRVRTSLNFTLLSCGTYRMRGGGNPGILEVSKLGGKMGNAENYTDFHISKLARLFVHYPYAVYA
jgi:hypothetical protein